MNCAGYRTSYASDRAYHDAWLGIRVRVGAGGVFDAATHHLRKGNEPVQGLSTGPFRSSMKLARIVATSQTVDEDALRERVLTRAR